MPDLMLEMGCEGVVCGVDEAGRGPWAGPVVAAAVILDRERIANGINDSKKLSSIKRSQLNNLILESAETAVGIATVEEIDRLNILQATMLAMCRAVEGLPSAPELALVDGNKSPPLSCRTLTIVKGDAKSLSIAAASIVAKVTRDRLMAELAEQYPGYGFERHAGYGTPEHQRALAELGVTPHHRRSYAPIRKLLEAAA